MSNHTITTTQTSPDLQLCPASPDAHDIFRRTVDTADVSDSGWNIQPITTIRPDHHQNPRKKRTKMIRFHNTKSIVGGDGPSGSHSGMITKKKPDPSAPKITRPCTECGKRFWSWKALFGHMRCHPERSWRGINPPANVHHPPPDHEDFTTQEDEYVAACLLMLSNSSTVSQNNTTTHTSTSYHHHSNSQDMLMFPVKISDPETRFECSSCKKVFGSHQALGGHRASHKNVKGCFAITRTDSGTGTEELEYGEVSGINQQHKCSICLKIFSSGQALGGHKRCHLEKEEGVVPTATTSLLSKPFRFDLNTPAIQQDDSTCSSSDLDLRLCL